LPSSSGTVPCLLWHHFIYGPFQNGVQPEPFCQSPSGADSSDNGDDEDCEDEDDSSLTVTPTTSPSTAKATPTAKASPTATPHSSSAAKAKATDAAVNVDTHIFSGGVYVTDFYDTSAATLTHHLLISATFYFQGGNAGACGQHNSDDALIAAMGQSSFSLNAPAGF